jgi:heparin binding hemagglutinin HbhA
MTDPRTPRIPAPLYAAAGVGDLALQQLRKLPAVVTELSEKAAISTAELREKAAISTAELREKAASINTAELRERALTGTAELREKAGDALRTANTTATSLRGRKLAELDVDRLRTAAIRNAAVVVSGAYAASERAAAAYGAMVARGERVVGSVGTPAEAPAAADIELTEAPTELTANPAAKATKTPAVKATRTTPAVKATKATKPAKRTPANDEK